MPVRRIRIGTRMLLVLIAVLALVMGAESIRRSSIYYRNKMEYHAYRVDGYRESQTWYTESREISRSLEMVVTEDETITQMTALADYHDDLRQKYAYAATHPWSIVPPDPPPPYDPFADEEEWTYLRQRFPWLPDKRPSGS